MTPKRPAHLVQVIDVYWTVSDDQTARNWIGWRATPDVADLLDRCSRPRRSHNRCEAPKLEHAAAQRRSGAQARRRNQGTDRVAQQVCLSKCGVGLRSPTPSPAGDCPNKHPHSLKRATSPESEGRGSCVYALDSLGSRIRLSGMYQPLESGITGPDLHMR